jgi:hypothetical protein
MWDWTRKALSIIDGGIEWLERWIDEKSIGAPVVEQPLTIRNEILKLRASAADRLSTACFSLGAAGVIAPLFAPTFQHGLPIKLTCDAAQRHDKQFLQALKNLNAECAMPWTYGEITWIAATVLIWLFAGLLLHMIGEVFLLKLGEK